MAGVKRNRLGDLGEDVFSRGALVTLQTRCWGAVSVLPEEFYGDQMPPEVCRAVFDLLPDKTKLNQIKEVRDEAKRYLYKYSLPAPVDGFVFILKKDIPTVQEGLNYRKQIFFESVDEFIAQYEEEKGKFQQQHPHLFIPEKYPSPTELRGKFRFRWLFRHFTVTGTSEVLPPEVYEEQLAQARKDLREMIDTGIRTIGAQFYDAIRKIRDQCGDGKVNTATINNFHNFLEDFEGKWDEYLGHGRLREMVRECKQYLEDVDAADIRNSDELRGLISEGMQEVIEKFEKTADARLHRKLDF